MISDKVRWFGHSAINRPNRKDHALQEHGQIIAALKEKNAEKAKQAVLQHIENNRMAVLSSLEIPKEK